MKEGLGSGNLSGRVERSRGPFGCLVVKKKGEGVGVSHGASSGKEKVVVQSKVRKRPRLILSESESDEENSLVPPPTEVGSTTPGPLRNDKSKFIEAGNERKRSKVDDTGHPKKLDKVLFKDGLEERRTDVGRNGVLIPKPQVPINKKRELNTDSRKNISLDKRDGSDFAGSSNVSVELEREPVGVDRRRFDENKTGNIRSGLPREKCGVRQGEPMRVQGKNGVLKVMSCNKNNVGGHGKNFSPENKEENRKVSRSADFSNGKARLSPSTYSQDKLHEKSHSVIATNKKHVNSLKKRSIKPNGVRTQASETTLLQQSKDVDTYNSNEVPSNKKQKTTTPEPCVSKRRKEGEVNRGSATEKQLLREQIRQMLLNAGWTIDLRPRRSRDYQDSVYINPKGTEYWSVTKAYYAFQKQSNVEGRDQKHSGDSSSFTSIPEDVLSKLTRNTTKKIERERQA